MQQQYRVNDFKAVEENKDEEEDAKTVVVVEEEEEKPKEEELEAQEEEVQQEEEVEEQQEPDDRGEEIHEEFEESIKDENEESVELYDANVTREIQVNSKNKATSLKKIVLESIGLSTKKAQIMLLKQVANMNPEGGKSQGWQPFGDEDYDQ